jgi:hypothetical protein
MPPQGQFQQQQGGQAGYEQRYPPQQQMSGQQQMPPQGQFQQQQGGQFQQGPQGQQQPPQGGQQQMPQGMYITFDTLM